MSVEEAVEPVATGSRAHFLRQSTMIKDQNSRIRYKGDESLNISSILNESWMMRSRHGLDINLGQTVSEEGSNWEETAALLDEAHYQVMCELGGGGGGGAGGARVAGCALQLAQACQRALHAQPVWRHSRPPHAALAAHAASWQLLHALAADTSPPRPPRPAHEQPSPRDLVLAVEREESALRLLRVLVSWLEESAAAQELLLRPEATPAALSVAGAGGTVGTVGAHWANTTHHLLLGESLFDRAPGAPGARLVFCVDPDAPRRQQRRLHSDDQLDDEELCKRIFKEIRCGKLDEAVAQCLAAGQPWRAALLQGCRAAHYERCGPGAGVRLRGNPALELWRWSCGELARSDADSVYMRAALGVLSGRAGGGAAVAAACAPCWEDLAWAACSAALHQHAARALREDARAPPPVLAAPAPPAAAAAPDEPPSLPALLDSVTALMDGAPLTVYQRCQRHLILGEMDALDELLAEHADTVDDEFLIRFLVHVVLVVRALGTGGTEPGGEGGARCVERYVRQCAARASCLQSAAPRLALYCAACGERRARALWPDVLERARTPAERRALAAAGAAHALDVPAALRELVARATRAPHHDAADSALAWLTLADGAGEDAGSGTLGLSAQEALALGVQLVRAHVGAGAMEAGGRALRALQPLSAATSAAAPSSAALRHYLSWHAYVEAVEAFGAWQRHRAQQPQPPPPPPLRGEHGGGVGGGGAQSALAARVQAEALVERRRGEAARRAESERQLARRAHRKLLAVLQFPGGWLPGGDGDGAGDEAVRRACLGEATRLAAALLEHEQGGGGGGVEGGSLVALVGGAARRLYAALDRRTLRLVLAAAARHHLAAMRHGAAC